jgi:hypothetical protein
MNEIDSGTFEEDEMLVVDWTNRIDQIVVERHEVLLIGIAWLKCKCWIAIDVAGPWLVCSAERKRRKRNENLLNSS